MAFEVRDELWEVIEPLLPAIEPAATGRPRVSDRVAFNAIVFVPSWSPIRFDDVAPAHGPPRRHLSFRGPPLLLA